MRHALQNENVLLTFRAIQEPPLPLDDRDASSAAAERALVQSAVRRRVVSECRQRVRLLAVREVPRRRLAGRLPARLLLQHHEAHGPGQVVLRGPAMRRVVSVSPIRDI